jgi:hypothetical protein
MGYIKCGESGKLRNPSLKLTDTSKSPTIEFPREISCPPGPIHFKLDINYFKAERAAENLQ